MKKMMAVLLAFAMCVSMTTVFADSVPQAPQKNYPQKFWDVPKDYWAFPYIAELTDRGAINGNEDGSYRPENTVTRAEWAKIMMIAAGVKTDDNNVYYRDMKGHWANAYVNAAADYLSAYKDGTFKPDLAAVREDVTVSMVKLKGYDVSDADYSYLTGFSDPDSVSSDLKKYVSVAVEKGLINGFEDNTFRGQATLTRAEAATILWRAFQYGSDNKVANAGSQNLIPSSDFSTETSAPDPTLTPKPTPEPSRPATSDVNASKATAKPAEKPTPDPTEAPPPDPTEAPRPYVIDTVKTVDILEDSIDFYSYGGRDIYYVDSDSIIKKFNIDTGTETTLLDFNKEIDRLSYEDDPLSETDNIYMNGAEILQVFYDKYRDRVLVHVYLKQPREYRYYQITDGTLEPVMDKSGNADRLYLSLPDKLIGLDYIRDAERGIVISNSPIYYYNLSYGSANAYYINDTLYLCTKRGWVYKGVSNGGMEEIRGIYGAAAINDGFIYALQSNGDINIYNMSGAEKNVIKRDDIAVLDGVPNISGRLFFTDDGEMMLFNGAVFRMIKENN